MVNREKNEYSSEGLLLRLLREFEVYAKSVIDRRIDGAICTNTKLEQLAPTDNTTVVRGVPSVGYPDEMPTRSRDTEDIVVMFASKLDKERGIGLFLEATKKIDREDIQFWIAGYGSSTEQVKSQVAELADDRVEFFGLLLGEEYQQHLVDSDILVNFQDPSLIESEYVFPSKLLDFMSAQSVILSTDMSDIADCFQEKVVIAEQDYEIESLESVIETVATDPSAYDSQIEEAKRWINKQTKEEHKKKIQEVIDNT
jgi:glycosyltransferase involved in cell wall biosynthesis